MNQTHRLRTRLRSIVPSVALCCALSTTPAHAVNKDMVQLQTQIQQLQDAVARLQQSNDERMGVMKDLVQQSADSINKMSATVDAMQRGMQSQQEAQGAKVDQISGQVQALNDSLDEIKARIGRLEKLMQDVQGQQQSMSANMQGMPAGSAAGATPAGNAPTSTLPPLNSTGNAAGNGSGSSLDNAAPPLAAAPERRGKPSAGTPLNATGAAGAGAAGAGAPPVDDLYKTALGDYMSAKYGLAASEFSDVSRSYPEHPLAGNAYYYQGEIEYRGARYAAAIKDYDRVIEQFPDNNKVPAAHLHKGQSLLQMRQNDAGVRELRALIQRFPNSPEAMQARSRLSGMGIPTKPRG